MEVINNNQEGKTMISNQYQNQPTFQGNLLAEGLKLPKRKFNEVAKIYSQRTAGKPDLILSGKRQQNELGRFYHATDALFNGKDIATILTSTLKNMFETLSPKKMAAELVNLSMKFDPAYKANILRKEINDTKRRLLNIKFRIEHSQSPAATNRLQALAEIMERTIAKKEKQLAKFKPLEVSGDWHI